MSATTSSEATHSEPGRAEATGAETSAPVALGPSQTLRKALLLGGVILGIGFLVVGDSYWPDEHWLHNTCEWVGLALILVCICGRTWCSLYIGGQKNRRLVADGPYSVCRNPLYSFSILGAVGVGLQAGSMLAGAICGFVAYVVLIWTVRREEASLLAAFGEPYRHYLATVPRFLFKPSQWRSPDVVEVRPRVVLGTFLDALVFLAAIPLAEGLEWLHDAHWLPTYLNIP